MPTGSIDKPVQGLFAVRNERGQIAIDRFVASTDTSSLSGIAISFIPKCPSYTERRIVSFPRSIMPWHTEGRRKLPKKNRKSVTDF